MTVPDGTIPHGTVPHGTVPHRTVPNKDSPDPDRPACDLELLRGRRGQKHPPQHPLNERGGDPDPRLQVTGEGGWDQLSTIHTTSSPHTGLILDLENPPCSRCGRDHRTCMSKRFTYTRSLRKLLPFHDAASLPLKNDVTIRLDL
jgi:hypothetical protein